MTCCPGVVEAKGNDMDTLHIANGVMSLLGAGIVSRIILHPDIHEGFVAKVGLIAIVFSLLATAALALSGADDRAGLWAAGLVLRAGLVLVCGAILWRARSFLKSNRRARRNADWRDILTGK